MPGDLKKRRLTFTKKNPWPALILHNTWSVQREQNTGEKNKRKQPTFSAGGAGFSPAAGGSCAGIAARRAASRTSEGMSTGASAMLSDKKAGHEQIRLRSDDGKALKYYTQYPGVMQGSLEGKRAN